MTGAMQLPGEIGRRLARRNVQVGSRRCAGVCVFGGSTQVDRRATTVTKIPQSSSDTSGRGQCRAPIRRLPATPDRAGGRAGAEGRAPRGGPGDATLLTARGRELLERADVVVVDRGGVLCRRLRPGSRSVPPRWSRRPGRLRRLRTHARSGPPAARLSSGSSPGTRCSAGVVRPRPRSWPPKASHSRSCPACRWRRASAAYAGVPAGTPFCVATLTSDGDADLTGPCWQAPFSGDGAVAAERSCSLVGKVAGSLIEHGRPGDTPISVTL